MWGRCYGRIGSLSVLCSVCVRVVVLFVKVKIVESGLVVRC